MMLLKISRGEFLDGIAAGSVMSGMGGWKAHTDGTSCGMLKPTRGYGERLDRAAE